LSVAFMFLKKKISKVKKALKVAFGGVRGKGAP